VVVGTTCTGVVVAGALQREVWTPGLRWHCGGDDFWRCDRWSGRCSRAETSKPSCLLIS
jgi:hypothetical protein